MEFTERPLHYAHSCGSTAVTAPTSPRPNLRVALIVPGRWNCFAERHDLAGCLICIASTASYVTSGMLRKATQWTTCPVVGRVLRSKVRMCWRGAACAFARWSSVTDRTYRTGQSVCPKSQPLPSIRYQLGFGRKVSPDAPHPAFCPLSPGLPSRGFPFAHATLVTRHHPPKSVEEVISQWAPWQND